jgi:lipopolysaccharide transport system ATP-binding protein
MSDIAIKVENLSKQYRIAGLRRAPYRTLRESLVETVQAPFRRAAKLLRGEVYGAAEMDRTFWALKNVFFEVERGEVVGVIGANGAGKSTLLKILSRITEPTEGYAEIHGRVGSLLEVGTGFHPELTGRENIYLNGAILGMKRWEIERKFDEIVDFSGVEKFIETPVKCYSDGMRVRLAFSVAAHLEPEILLVDEVLAVGDAAFQKKCLGKMEDVSREGRTVLFVSHDMGAVESLCETSILLTQGCAARFRSAREGVSVYLGGRASNGVATLRSTDFAGSLKHIVEFCSLKVMGSEGKPCGILSPSEAIRLKVRFTVREPVLNFRTTFAVFARGVRLFSLHDAPLAGETVYPGDYESLAIIPAYFLRPGEYSIAMGGYRDGMTDYVWGTDLLYFQVAEVWDELNDQFNLGLVNVPASRCSRTCLRGRERSER